jgi:hypothetical protein
MSLQQHARAVTEAEIPPSLKVHATAKVRTTACETIVGAGCVNWLCRIRSSSFLRWGHRHTVTVRGIGPSITGMFSQSMPNHSELLVLLANGNRRHRPVQYSCILCSSVRSMVVR